MTEVEARVNSETKCDDQATTATMSPTLRLPRSRSRSGLERGDPRPVVRRRLVVDGAHAVATFMPTHGLAFGHRTWCVRAADDRRSGEEVADEQVADRREAQVQGEAIAPSRRSARTGCSDAISDTRSADQIVRHVILKLRGAAFRIERPLRISSFMRSKNTTYVSTVTPTATMMPVTPARVSA